jgi:hypothetical protein
MNEYFIASIEAFTVLAQVVMQIDNRTGGSGEGEQAVLNAVTALNTLKASMQGLIDVPPVVEPETPAA